MQTRTYTLSMFISPPENCTREQNCETGIKSAHLHASSHTHMNRLYTHTYHTSIHIQYIIRLHTHDTSVHTHRSSHTHIRLHTPLRLHTITILSRRWSHTATHAQSWLDTHSNHTQVSGVHTDSHCTPRPTNYPLPHFNTHPPPYHHYTLCALHTHTLSSSVSPIARVPGRQSNV